MEKDSFFYGDETYSILAATVNKQHVFETNVILN